MESKKKSAGKNTAPKAKVAAPAVKARPAPVAKAKAPPPKAPAGKAKVAPRPPAAKSHPAPVAPAPAPRPAVPAKAAAPSARPRHGGLGRGLDALISAQSAAAREQAARAARNEIVSTIKNRPDAARDGKAPAAPAGEELLKVNTSLIRRSPWQPRDTFNPESLRELAETIKAHGLIQPLTCRRLPESKGGGFELISGERRLRAAIEAGLSEVPVRVIDASDRDAAEMAIIENVQRDDLNAIEEAEGYRTLVEKFSLTQQEVADRVGKGRASVAHALRLLELPDEVKQLVSAGQLSVGHAKVLLSLEGETEQVLLARRSVVDGMSVRALERAIARRGAEKTESESRRPDIPESHARFLLDKMHAFFGAPVRLRPSVTFANGKRAKGCIEVDFADNDDLTRILELLGISVD